MEGGSTATATTTGGTSSSLTVPHNYDLNGPIPRGDDPSQRGTRGRGRGGARGQQRRNPNANTNASSSNPTTNPNASSSNPTTNPNPNSRPTTPTMGPSNDTSKPRPQRNRNVNNNRNNRRDGNTTQANDNNNNTNNNSPADSGSGRSTPRPRPPRPPRARTDATHGQDGPSDGTPSTGGAGSGNAGASRNRNRKPKDPQPHNLPNNSNTQDPSSSSSSKQPMPLSGQARRRANFGSSLTQPEASSNTTTNNSNSKPTRRPLPTGTDLTSTLIRSLSTPPYPDCLICFSAVRPEQAVWSCSPEWGVLGDDDANATASTNANANASAQYCWKTFHVKCIKSWADKSVKDLREAWRSRGVEDWKAKGEWRCPGCQVRRKEVPNSCPADSITVNGSVTPQDPRLQHPLPHVALVPPHAPNPANHVYLSNTHAPSHATLPQHATNPNHALLLCGKTSTASHGDDATNKTPSTSSTASSITTSSTTLKCTTECHIAKRNARLADALGIAPEKRDASGGHVQYNDELVGFARANMRFVGVVEKAFKEFVEGQSQSNAVGGGDAAVGGGGGGVVLKKQQVLPHMPPERRKFVHDLAGVYRMDTQMVDVEPHRSVQIIRRIDTRIPNPTLSAYVASMASNPNSSSSSLGKLADLRTLRPSPSSSPAPFSSSSTVTQQQTTQKASSSWNSIVSRQPKPQTQSAAAWLQQPVEAASGSSWRSTMGTSSGARPGAYRHPNAAASAAVSGGAASRTGTPPVPSGTGANDVNVGPGEDVPDNWEDDL
ncbi:hypothetical protein CVT24_010263 [Panaeolus cyanescens]|uniref:R3H domain-containing protein n=1 Tax=Panaeolus cyanescens TaxID=181874 RepID=A0A409YPZ6_9AGAR|nr:hypothetical protein CVT24_010263 [Panaeolus cyanescens]